MIKKNALVRVPIRLGADVFTTGSISKYNRTRMIDTMTAFKLLMSAHGVEQYKACATSAMREASNGPDLVLEVKEKAGLSID